MKLLAGPANFLEGESGCGRFRVPSHFRPGLPIRVHLLHTRRKYVHHVTRSELEELKEDSEEEENFNEAVHLHVASDNHTEKQPNRLVWLIRERPSNSTARFRDFHDCLSMLFNHGRCNRVNFDPCVNSREKNGNVHLDEIHRFINLLDVDVVIANDIHPLYLPHNLLLYSSSMSRSFLSNLAQGLGHR